MSDLQEQGANIEEFQEAFARIEAAVDAGETDLSSLGFWKLVRRVKVDAALSHHWADVVGRIDRKAFERRVRPTFPVWLGNGVLGIGTAVGGGALGYAVVCDNRVVAGALLVASAGILSVSAHDLAHWLVGRLAGIRFLAYFLDGPFRIQPGLKIDYSTYLTASPGGRARMHAAGALASKAAPFVALALWPAADAPAWAFWMLLGIGLIQISTDVLWSTKKSDWKKVRREGRLARTWEPRRRL